MSLTITAGVSTPKNKKTGDDIVTPLYGFVSFSSHIPGLIEASLLAYNSKEDCEARKLPVPFVMQPHRLLFPIPEGQEPSLSLAQNKVKETLEAMGLTVEINIVVRDKK